MKHIKDFLMHRLLFRNMVNQNGASAVEFAIVLPVLLIFLFGIIEFGLIVYNKQVITNAAREGARAGIVAREPNVTEAQMRNIAKKYAMDRLITFGNNEPTFEAKAFEDVNLTTEINNISNADYEDFLQCKIKFDYEFLVFPGTINLDGTSVMIYE